MTHQFYLKDPDTGTLFHLPDTPPDFHFDAGRSVEKFEMAQDSEVHLPGLKTLFNRPFEFLLPSERGRSYAPKDWNGDPYPTVEKIVAWSNAGILSPTHTTSMDIAGMQSSTTPLQDGDFIISKNGWIAGYVKTGVNETVYYLVNVGGLECNVAGTDEIPYKIYR